MEQNIDTINTSFNNIDDSWFYSEISRRLKKIEVLGEHESQSVEIAKEIAILYFFFIDQLKKNYRPTKGIIRDFFYDSEYLLDMGLLHRDFKFATDFRIKQDVIKKIVKLLPKIPSSEEPERDYLLANSNVEKYCTDFIVTPQKASEYVLSSLINNNGGKNV